MSARAPVENEEIPMKAHRLAFAAVFALLACTVQAQNEGARGSADEESVPVRILEIRAGQMLLDGRVLPEAELPQGLNLEGIEDFSYHFSGPVTPAIEIDGRVYILDGERVISLDESDRAGDQVYFFAQPEMAAAPAPPSPPSPPAEPLIQASEQAYLRQLSSRDQSLYEQIQREQALEMETLRLAERIRRTEEAAARDRLVEDLRDKLEASFDLKQRIRADEIEQAEAQIEELRRMLSARQARKAQIIDRRLRELVGDER